MTSLGVDTAANLVCVESVSVEHEDGTVDTCQQAPLRTELDPQRLERIYWGQMRRMTLGFAQFSGDAVRAFGVWPVIVRFGPLIDGRRAIVGGFLVRRPTGTIAWRASGEHTSVALEGFSPLLRGPMWRLQSWFHELVGKRFLAYVARGGL